MPVPSRQCHASRLFIQRQTMRLTQREAVHIRGLRFAAILFAAVRRFHQSIGGVAVTPPVTVQAMLSVTRVNLFLTHRADRCQTRTTSTYTAIGSFIIAEGRFDRRIVELIRGK